MKKKYQFNLIITVSFVIVGIIIGATWHALRLFPFPQLHNWKTNGTQGSDAPSGRWRRAKPVSKLTKEQERQLQTLRSIGYLAGSKSAPSRSDVTLDNADRVYEGLNLVVSGHGPEAILMDMHGKELHKWQCDVYRAWPDFNPKKYFGDDKQRTHTFWRRAQILPNGDLYAIFAGIGIIKLDKNSNLLWSVQNGAHHDLHIAQNGDIYTLTREAGINPVYNAKDPILEDFIVVLNEKGEELRKVSVLECIRNSFYSHLLARLKPSGDILHSNTIELLENIRVHRSPHFRDGIVLISILYLDLVCAVDLEEETIIWAESDLWRRQHQPTLLDNGNILILNNMASNTTSSVIEFDPLTRELRWCYFGDKSNPFFTETCGSCQRLPNGNTLIVESDPGRAFEVTPEKEIVWEYVNPYRAGKKNELIATLFDVVRIEKDFPSGWIQ